MEPAVLRYANLYRVISKTFGLRLRPVGTFGLIQLQHALTSATMGLDRVLYPSCSTEALRSPVFVLGNPRSGTTFLHHTLADSGTVCAFELWEMMFPAISARKMLGGAIDRFAPLSPARFHRSEAHPTTLRGVETDDAMGLFHFVDGPFVWSYFYAWQDDWWSEQSRRVFDPSSQPPGQSERWFAYLEACWRRNVVYKGIDRIAVKSSSMTIQAEALVQRYPDCRILYCVRDPLEVIPSGMSLVTGVLEESYQMSRSTTAEARAKFFENLYQASCHFYRAFYETWKQGLLPEKNLRIVPYPSLMRDLEGTMNSIFEFIEVQPSREVRERIHEQSEKQRTRVSKHKYSLAEFGLDEERIRRDLAFVYEAFSID